jgi:hypothetical protein
MNEVNFPLRVTNWFCNKNQLMSWKKFLEDKGYETLVVFRTLKKANLYALYRNLSFKEEKEIESGDYVIMDESLKRAKLGVIIKEIERWK